MTERKCDKVMRQQNGKCQPRLSLCISKFYENTVYLKHAASSTRRRFNSFVVLTEDSSIISKTNKRKYDHLDNSVCLE